MDDPWGRHWDLSKHVSLCSKIWRLLSGFGNRPSHQAWQGRSLKELMSLKATTKQWYMGSWWINPPASSPLREDDPYTWPVWSPKFLSGIEPQLPTRLKTYPWQSSFNSQSQFFTSFPVFSVFTSQLNYLRSISWHHPNIWTATVTPPSIASSWGHS